MQKYMDYTEEENVKAKGLTYDELITMNLNEHDFQAKRDIPRELLHLFVLEKGTKGVQILDIKLALMKLYRENPKLLYLHLKCI